MTLSGFEFFFFLDLLPSFKENNSITLSYDSALFPHKDRLGPDPYQVKKDERATFVSVGTYTASKSLPSDVSCRLQVLHVLQKSTRFLITSLCSVGLPDTSEERGAFVCNFWHSSNNDALASFLLSSPIAQMCLNCHLKSSNYFHKS